MKQNELQEQQTLFEFLTMIESQVPLLQYGFHVPNGGHRHPAVAAKMKAAGVKRGVPDLLFPISFQGYHGLAIEMKSGYNRTTKEQLVWLDVLAEQGWKTAVCYGWVTAAIEIVSYVGIDPKRYNLDVALDAYERQHAKPKSRTKK
jgi:VRR-NUC domain